MIVVRNVALSDLDRCFEIESRSYGDEGASKARIKKRIEAFPEGFLVLTIEGQIEGFINSGCSQSDDLADEGIKAMIGHDPRGKHLIVFSVVVIEEKRGQKLATRLMNEFIQFAKEQRKPILLMCKTEHIDMYCHFGFRLLGLSDSSHGGIEWYEMIMDNYV